MQKVKINQNNPEPKIIDLATKKLEEGKVVVCPTDTVYIFAVDATNESALKKLFKLKGRQFTKPIHVVVSDLDMAEKYVYLTETARKLAAAFLPGPLTLVLKKKNNLPEIQTASKDTLGIRVPGLDFNTELAKKFGKPYTATSANKSSGPNPYSVEEVIRQFSDAERKLLDLVVDAGRLPRVDPSTIVDCSEASIKILRAGPVSRNQIEEVLDKKLQVESGLD